MWLFQKRRPTEADKCSGGPNKLIARFFSLCCCGVVLLWFIAVQGHNLAEPFAADYDEGVYLSSAKAVTHGDPLFTSVFCSQPPLFVETLALGFRVFGPSIVLGRAIILGFAVLSLASIAILAWRLIGPMGAPLAMIALAVPPSFFESSRICQAEIPSVAPVLVGMVLVPDSSGKRHLLKWALVGAFFMFGLLTKLLVVSWVIPLLFMACVLPESLRSSSWSFEAFSKENYISVGKRIGVFGLSCLLIVILVLTVFDSHALYIEVVSFHRDAKQVFGHSWGHNLSIIWRTIENSAGILMLSLSGLVALWHKNRPACIWLLAWLGSNITFLMTHAPLWDRHVVIMVPPLALGASAALLLFPNRHLLLLCPYLSFCALLAVDSSSNRLKLLISTSWLLPKPGPASEVSEIVGLIQEHTVLTEMVVTDEQMLAFRADRSVPPNLCDTSFVRVRSGYLTDADAIRSAAGAKMIILWTHRLDQLPGFVEWSRTNYCVLKESDGRRVLVKTTVREQIR